MHLGPRTCSERPRRAGYFRVSGTLVMVGLVVIGFSVGALSYSWKEPQVRARVQAELDAAPTTAEGRLGHWMEHGAPQVHHHLSDFARISAERPWIVTHTVAAKDGGAPAVYGIDVKDLPRDLLRSEGLTVVLTLAAPTQLGRADLGGDSAAHIPHFAQDLGPEEAAARLEKIVRFLLRELIAALESDIEGASFEVRIGA